MPCQTTFGVSLTGTSVARPRAPLIGIMGQALGDQGRRIAPVPEWPVPCRGSRLPSGENLPGAVAVGGHWVARKLESLPMEEEVSM